MECNCWVNQETSCPTLYIIYDLKDQTFVKLFYSDLFLLVCNFWQTNFNRTKMKKEKEKEKEKKIIRQFCAYFHNYSTLFSFHVLYSKYWQYAQWAQFHDFWQYLPQRIPNILPRYPQSIHKLLLNYPQTTQKILPDFP